MLMKDAETPTLYMDTSLHLRKAKERYENGG
jgi:hypothetical protein